MAAELRISLLGELRVEIDGADLPLPASRKARALLAFLVATGRPHRRERLCELFWDLPDDPKAALRWSLSKLRRVIDDPERARIIADRERVAIDAGDVAVDLRDIHARLRRRDACIPAEDLAGMADRLARIPFDGLDGAGGDSFDSWLTAEREDARAAHVAVLRLLATHPDLTPVEAAKWRRLWREADPEGAAAHEAVPAPAPVPAPEPVPALGDYEPLAIREAAQTPFSRSRALRSQRIGFCRAGDGARIAYATIGAGPPLLKAANWLTHLEFDWDSPIWGRGFAELARYRTFVRYDERGNGLSDWDVREIGFEAFVEDLEIVADDLGLDRFPLLGISQGAAVSIEYAVRHPERVSGLILLGGYASGWRIHASPEEQARREAVLTLTEVGWGTDNPAYRHIFSQTFMPEATTDELAWFDDFQRQTTSPRNAARFQDAFGRIDVRHRLEEVRVPTLVLHSTRDMRIPLEMGRALADGIPDARFVPLESRNHILVDREPAWRNCVDEIGSFLAENRI